MMKECEKIQEILLDTYNVDYKITKDIALHIENCSECQKFYQQLVRLNENLSIDIETIDIDYQSISLAINEGTKKRETRESIWNNIGFILMAVSLFTILGFVVSFGYVSIILIIQVVMISICPLAIPFVIYKQLKGGA
ncbi:MAG: hypothetical protein ACOWWH_08670 [Eubacteriaceae bacterium]